MKLLGEFQKTVCSKVDCCRFGMELMDDREAFYLSICGKYMILKKFYYCHCCGDEYFSRDIKIAIPEEIEMISKVLR